MTKHVSASPFLLALLVLAFASGVYAQEPNSTSATSEWQRYEVGKGSLSVLFPNKPTETTQATPSSGDQIGNEMYLYTSATAEAIYVSQVSFLDKPAAPWGATQIASFYQGFWKGLRTAFDDRLKRSNSTEVTKLIEEKRVTFAGSSGVEFVFVYGSTEGRVLVTLVGNRAFAGLIFGTEKISRQLQEQFFGSFKILPLRTSKLLVKER